ncbi:MAG: hypothetical protein ACI4TX_04450 [Christensenellales bacterium]
MQFKIVKNGYDVNEVNKFIKNQEMSYSLQCDKQKDRIMQLSKENEMLKQKLADYIAKEANISNALLIAVEKAKQIEEGSKKIYELEIQKLRLLFNKYKVFLDDLINSHSDSSSIKTTKALIEDFKKSINTTLSTNFNGNIKTVSAYDPMRALLSKMNTYIAKRNLDASKVIADYDNDTREERIFDHFYEKNNIKPISNVELKDDEKFENVVDKFLEVGDEEANALAKHIINGDEDYKNNGFDLKEAVNPTESLEEIMKDFDFYLGDDDKKN